MRSASAAIVSRFRWQPRRSIRSPFLELVRVYPLRLFSGPGIGQARIVFNDGFSAAVRVACLGVCGTRKYMATLVLQQHRTGETTSVFAHEIGNQAIFSSERMAVVSLYLALSRKCRDWVASFACDLSVGERRNRSIIFAAVDIIRSELDAPSPERSFLYGKVVAFNGKQVFRVNHDTEFNIDNRLSLADGAEFYGWVCNDRHGSPIGPLVEPDELSYRRAMMTNEEREEHDSLIWSEWEKRHASR